jgi:small subunit ribosomal protein S20
MAHHKSALKRIRQTRKRKIYNRQYKKSAKFAIRAVRESKTYDVAIDNFKKATSILDRVAAKGILHANTASNKKSSLAKYVNKLRLASSAN